MIQNGQDLYRCIECGEMVEKFNQFIHDIKCQSNKNKNRQEEFICEICLRPVKLIDKEEHLHCHELERRNISEIINLSTNINISNSSNNISSNKGLNDETINNYPTSKIKNINDLSENKKKCLICLDEFKNGQKSIILPCIHIFHCECIKKWMKKENFCPLCKNKII